MKGFVGGIPVALLAVAAQAQFVERQEQGFHPHPQTGATNFAGPSGNDGNQGFVSPYSANIKTNTQVKQWSNDNHSIDVKHKDVYGQPGGAFGSPATSKGPQVPGMGPFNKRHVPPGGTVFGGPSGNDEGQTFDMPTTGIINTNVNDYNKDNHNIGVDHTDVHPAVHPPPRVNGSPRAGFAGSDSFEKRVGSHRPNGPEDFPHPPQGATVFGGPSGNDGGQSFSAPNTVLTHTGVNTHNEDDHTIGVHHQDVYPHPSPFRRSENVAGPPHGGPQGATIFGGPSGNDGGQGFSAPNTAGIHTGVKTHNEDDHSIGIHHKDVYPHPGPFRRSENIPGPPQGGPHGGPHDGPHGGPPHGGPHGGPPGHFEPHPETHYAPHSEHHVEPHPEPHYEPHPEPHFENHPEPHTENHPEPHNEPHYSPSYEPHYEPHHSVDNELTSLKNLNNGPAAGSIKFGRRDAPGSHFEPHPESHFEPHAESHVEPHPEPHFAPHPEPHYENHHEPHVHNHPEPHYAPHYSPSYEPHFEPHSSVKNHVTSITDSNNGPAAGSNNVGRRGVPAGPESHFEPHPESHFEPHAKSHVEPHPEPHFAPHPEPHYENHPEPHVHNHPEPHYAPHYSPSYEPHYAPHHSVDNELTAIKGVNNGPAAGTNNIGRRGQGAPGSHFEPHPESHFEPHAKSHVEPHPEPHYAPHPEPHYENHPEPHVHNHPEPHHEPHYSPSYEPHYEPHHSLHNDLTSIQNSNNGPAAGSIQFGRRAFAPGGTVFDGPSGDDEGSSFSAPTNVGVATGVNEDNEDDHSIKDDRTNVYPSEAPYNFQSPQAPQEQNTPETREEAPQCSAQVREVVRTVTKTQYKTSEATPAAYDSVPAVQSNAVPVANTPQQSAQVDPKMLYSSSAPAAAPSEVPSFGYDYASQRPNSQAVPYSMIPVHVPMATPASSGAVAMATPSNSHGKNLPSGVSPEQLATPSSSAYASASPGAMFEGGATRVSGGFVSAAAAVMGVLAFII